MRCLYDRLSCIFPLLSTGVLTLQCHSCSHSASIIDATVSKCESRGFCEGKWCSQTLHDKRIIYGCDEVSPLDGVRLDIESFYHVVGIQGQRLFAYYYCKNGNYCNSAQSVGFKLVTIFAFFGLMLNRL